MTKYLFYLLLLCSCDPKWVEKQEAEEVAKLKDKGFEKVLEVCSECNGSGQAKLSTGSRVALTIITFGPGGLCETGQCETCKGEGIEEVIRKIK